MRRGEAPPRRRAARGASLLALACLVWATNTTADDEARCRGHGVLAAGRPDPTLFSPEASSGVTAYWCERYDALGRSIRHGPYWEREARGQLRSTAHYVDGVFEGPLHVYHEDGRVWLRATLEGGRIAGRYELFHPTGERWLEARFEGGRLHGPVRSWYPDGALESESAWRHGEARGLARTFHPSSRGGRLRSELHFSADGSVQGHRLLDHEGRPLARRAPARRPAVSPAQPPPAAPASETPNLGRANPTPSGTTPATGSTPRD